MLYGMSQTYSLPDTNPALWELRNLNQLSHRKLLDTDVNSE